MVKRKALLDDTITYMQSVNKLGVKKEPKDQKSW